MAERNLLFTWDLQSFDENKSDAHDLLSIRIESERKNLPLSQSLLMWEKDSEKWSLVDFKDKKVYHFEVNENEVEVSEEIGGWGAMETSPVNLLSLGTVYGTHEGFIDWLLTLVKFRVVTYNQSNLDDLERTDLSGTKLSFKIVHPNLLAAYEMLQEILTSPRESLLGLSKNNIKQFTAIADYIPGNSQFRRTKL